MRFLHLCGPYWLIALRWILRYEQKLQLPDKAWLWPSQDKTDPPSSNMLRNGFTQELLTASGPQTSDRGLDAVDHSQNY